MKLLYFPHAPYSRKVLLAAYEKAVAFEGEICAPFDKGAKARLKALHPLATVPLLVDGDDVITESSLIVEAFDMASDRGIRLVPRDPRAALQARAMDRFGDAHLMAPAAYLLWATRKPAESQNTDKIAAQRTVVDTALGLADGVLARQAFLGGESLSMADLSPVSAISCMLVDRTVPGLSRWPNVSRWYEQIIARPSFVAILEECATVALPSGV